MKRCKMIAVLVCILLLAAGCGPGGHDDTSSAIIPQESGQTPLTVPTADEMLPLFEALVKGYYGEGYFASLVDPVIEPLGSMMVEEELWYKISITTFYECIIYLMNTEGNRLYFAWQDAYPPAEIPVYECYLSITDPLLKNTTEDNSALCAKAAEKIRTNEKEDHGFAPHGIAIVNGEFMYLGYTSYGKGDERGKDLAYIATYAISLDGERLYKLGEKGIFHLQSR